MRPALRSPSRAAGRSAGSRQPRAPRGRRAAPRCAAGALGEEQAAADAGAPRGAPRRALLASLCALAPATALAPAASARTAGGRGFGALIKKKPLDPLPSYVPALLLSKRRLQALEAPLEAAEEGYDVYLVRNYLRQGVLGSLRSDMKAVSKYAVEADTSSDAEEATAVTLRALDEFDSAMLQASRAEAPAEEIEAILALLRETVASLDRVIATVPADILADAQAQVDLIEGTAPAAAPATPSAAGAAESAESSGGEGGAAISGGSSSSSKAVAKQADLFL